MVVVRVRGGIQVMVVTGQLNQAQVDQAQVVRAVVVVGELKDKLTLVVAQIFITAVVAVAVALGFSVQALVDLVVELVLAQAQTLD
jgi:hypothetical protein